MESVSWRLNYCRGIFLRSDMKGADFASNLRGRLVRGSLYFHTPCVFVVMRHVSRLTAWFQMCTLASVMVVTYFRAAPIGVQVCFSVQTPFDPSWRSQSVAWSNHFSSCSLINPLCSRNSIVAVLKCFVVAPWPRLRALQLVSWLHVILPHLNTLVWPHYC